MQNEGNTVARIDDVFQAKNAPSGPPRIGFTRFVRLSSNPKGADLESGDENKKTAISALDARCARNRACIIINTSLEEGN